MHHYRAAHRCACRTFRKTGEGAEATRLIALQIPHSRAPPAVPQDAHPTTTCGPCRRCTTLSRTSGRHSPRACRRCAGASLSSASAPPSQDSSRPRICGMRRVRGVASRAGIRTQELYDFLIRVFVKDPAKRPTMAQLLKHDFITKARPATDATVASVRARRRASLDGQGRARGPPRLTLGLPASVADNGPWPSQMVPFLVPAPLQTEGATCFLCPCACLPWRGHRPLTVRRPQRGAKGDVGGSQTRCARPLRCST